MQELIELYFSCIEIINPLLHRPTFERSIAAGEHLTNTLFGAVVLLVLACGARYSDDPRVFLEVDGLRNTLSCGWKWFDQVQMVNKSMMSTPELYEVQFICVRIILGLVSDRNTELPESCLHSTFLGLRRHRMHGQSLVWVCGWRRMLVRIGRKISLPASNVSSGNALSGRFTPVSVSGILCSLHDLTRALVVIDRSGSSMLGRACGIYDEE